MTIGNFHNILANYTLTSSFGPRTLPPPASRNHRGVDLPARADGTDLVKGMVVGLNDQIGKVGHSLLWKAETPLYASMVLGFGMKKARRIRAGFFA